YFLLRELGTSYASLDTALGTLRFPLEELDKAWTGDFLVLWRRETADTFIGPETRGDSIAWIWRRLAEIDGSPPLAAAPQSFDTNLREALRRFQRERGMLPDGYAGIRTLIALGDNQPGTPTLSGGS
ncbi:MAG TPA: peptidoglycan-binding domain-containing protein, partial [Solimonas sp.]|nr:peptidoglycan-binding domain-containing protein [Solimonas sp.]